MKRRKSRFLKFTEMLLAFSFVLFLVGSIYLNSYESQRNSKIKNTQDQISNVQSDIDALEMSKQELASFSRMKDVATKKGYDYQPSSAAAAVVGAEE